MKYHRLSSAAYKSDLLASEDAEAIGFSFVAHIHNEQTGADAMIFKSSDEVVIAFRGTQRDYADIMTDLKFRKAKLLLVKAREMIDVHRGFRDQWLSIKDQLHYAVASIGGPHQMLSVTGHSLGGALAVLAAVEWAWIENVVSFGAPRVSTSDIKIHMAKQRHQHRRYVYGTDIVPIVPLMAMGYRHDCLPIYLTRSGKAIADCPLWRELVGRARALFSMDWIEGWTWCRVPRRIFTDHKIIAEYKDALEKAAQ